MFVRGSIYLEWSKGGHGANNAREERESLVACICAEGCLEDSRRKVLWCGGVEKLKISILETTVEIFGLNWQLIELAS